ncbi:MAG TPA: hypothetical protein VGJ00_02585 [Rhabdochlamydiaceae bacterium]
MLKKFCQYLAYFITALRGVFAEEIDLTLYEKSLYSQNGEDGVLAKIFQLITPNSKFCVEFGAYDGVTGSNTFLLRLQNWNALLLDRTFEISHFNLYKEFITASNINALFKKYQVPCNFDLLSIDIDFNDFYIWQAIDEEYKPAVVVIEYNATHLPHEDKIVKYQPIFCGDGTKYYGASILSLYRLGRSKGYSLVYAEKNAVNLFFVRDDLLENRTWDFKNRNDVEKLYHHSIQKNGKNAIHAEDLKMRPFVSFEDVSACNAMKNNQKQPFDD